jgi:hypothetical protein
VREEPHDFPPRALEGRKSSYIADRGAYGLAAYISELNPVGIFISVKGNAPRIKEIFVPVKEFFKFTACEF